MGPENAKGRKVFTRAKRRIGRRAVGLAGITLSAALFASVITPAPAGAGTVMANARVPDNTPIYGGASNPCGDGAHPGVTREGEAEAAFGVNTKVKITVTGRTRYDERVAVAFDAIDRHGYASVDKCAVGRQLRNLPNESEAETLYLFACKAGTQNRPNLWCDAFGQITDNAQRDQLLKARSASRTYGSLDVDFMCAKPGFRDADPRPWYLQGASTGPFRFVGWDGINAHVATQYGFVKAYMKNVNFVSGARGDLGPNHDAPELSYGKTLNYEHVNDYATWLFGAVGNWNQANPGRRFDLNTVIRAPEDFLNAWKNSGQRLAGKTMEESQYDATQRLCWYGSWVADVLDPGFEISRIGQDKNFRNLMTELKGLDPAKRDVVCEQDQLACLVNAYDGLYAFAWDTGLDGKVGADQCKWDRGRKTVHDTLERKGRCNLHP